MSNDENDDFILRFQCRDQPGIIAALSGALLDEDADIREADIYGDPDTGEFFVRMVVRAPNRHVEALNQALTPVAERLGLNWRMHAASARMKVLVAVSKFDHCLNDLLHKWSIGALPVDIVGVVSNHETLRSLVEWRGLAYHVLPVTPETRPSQEARLLSLIEETGAELTVLARYMQILSDDLARRLEGRCINIHHSFLPSFKGARPYHQAHAQGVKLIGATAHYVTGDLDEGPIIEQDVRRVTHATSADEMIAIGREVEASVLARAVRWHAEHRVFLNGRRTVVLN